MREFAGFAGANATDGQGNDITSSVLACPAATCASVRCPSYEFSVFGLNACALDTSKMPVGSEVSIALPYMIAQNLPKAFTRVASSALPRHARLREFIAQDSLSNVARHPVQSGPPF
jgi:hypothetical protein